MQIIDWLFKRKQKKELLRQFDEMEKEYAAVDLPEGKPSDQGGVFCPNCGYELSMIEYLEQWQAGAVRIIECPNCQKEFKSH